METFICDSQNFVSDAFFDRKPVKLLEERSGMIVFLGTENQLRGSVLGALQTFDIQCRTSTQQRVGVVNP